MNFLFVAALMSSNGPPTAAFPTPFWFSAMDFIRRFFSFSKKNKTPEPVKTSKSNDHLGKMEASFAEGVFIGVKAVASEYYIAEPNGDVTSSSAIRRRPPAMRWDAAAIAQIQGTPWEMRPASDGKAKEQVKLGEEVAERPPEIPPEGRRHKITSFWMAG